MNFRIVDLRQSFAVGGARAECGEALLGVVVVGFEMLLHEGVEKLQAIVGKGA